MRRLSKALFLRVGARAVAAVLQAVTLVLIARSLGPDEFGVFGQAQSIGIVGSAALSFGLSARALRLSVEEDARRVITAMFILRILTSLAVVMIILIIFLRVDSERSSIIVAVAFVLLSDMVNELTQGVLSGLQRQRLAVATLIAHRLLPFLAVSTQPVPGLDLLGHFGLGCGLAVMTGLAHPLMMASKPANLMRLVSTSRGFWLTTGLGPLIQLDTTIIRLTSTLTFVGYYSAAARVGAPLNLVASSLVNIVVPAMASATDAEAKKRMFRGVRRVGLLLATGITVLSPVIVEVIIRLLGEEYRPGWPIFFGIIVGAAFSGVSQIYQAYFFAANLPMVAAFAVGCGTVFGLVVLGLGSVFWGIFGLAIGPIALQLAILTLFVMSYRKVDREAG